MAKQLSRLLVIDASVLRASGGTDAVHPTATQCRDFLLGVLSICHRVYVSEATLDEWKHHASKFARGWWTSMAARRKIEWVDDAEDREVRGRLAKATLSTKERSAIEKDLHLVEDALRADSIVVGIDVRLTEYIDKAATFARKLGKVRFIDPREETAEDI